MKIIFGVKYNKYRKFKNSEVSYIIGKTLVLSIICDKCGSKDENIFNEKESTEILKIIGFINSIEENQMKI